MIKVIVLKDTEATKGIVFVKCITGNDVVNFEVAIGFINKTKGTALKKGDVVAELPDTMLANIKVIQTNVASEGEEPVLIPILKIQA